ncbi:hypothetical protein, partial [Pseudoalteromonas maricaloris]
QALGYPPAYINYFYGELYRKRGNAGDKEKAISYYQEAIEHPTVPSSAYKHLAYLYLKDKKNILAKEHFQKYLDAEPKAK